MSNTMRTVSYPSGKTCQFSLRGPWFGPGLPHPCLCEFPSPRMCEFVSCMYEFSPRICGFYSSYVRVSRGPSPTLAGIPKKKKKSNAAYFTLIEVK